MTTPDQSDQNTSQPNSSLFGDHINNAPDPQKPLTPPALAGPPITQKHQRYKFIALGVIILMLIVGGGGYELFHKKPSPTNVANSSPSSILKIGTTIDENGLAADTQEYQPFINYLASQLHDQGITQAKFVPQTTVSAVVKSLNQSKTDIYIDSAFPVFVADRLSGSQLLADRWKEGVEKYHSAIFVKQDSPIKTIADLNGKIIAMDSPTSTVGYFLPKAELLKAGYKLTEKQTPTDSVSASEVGYEFVHGKVFDDVSSGLLPAGAESEQEIRDNFGTSFDQNFRIISTSPDVLRFAVTTRPGMKPALRTAIGNILLNMDKSDAGKLVLQKFADTTKFTGVGSDTSAAYGEIQKLTDYIEQEIISSGDNTSN